jgi:hypothetical protein
VRPVLRRHGQGNTAAEGSVSGGGEPEVLMVDPRREAMSQKAAEDVSRLLDRQGLHDLVAVADQAHEPESSDTSTCGVAVDEVDPTEAESA